MTSDLEGDMSGRALLVALAMAWGCLVPSAGWAAWVTLSEGAGKGPAVQVEETVPGVTTVRVRLVGFERQMVDAEGTRFELISVPGTGTLRDAGQPELPVVAVPVLVEGVGEVVAVRVKTREYAGVMAAPFAPRPKRCGGGEWRFVCDTGLYAQAEPFPETWVKVRQAGTARGAAAMALEVRPFRYWPAQRRLEVAWEVEVDLGAGQ